MPVCIVGQICLKETIRESKMRENIELKKHIFHRFFFCIVTKAFKGKSYRHKAERIIDSHAPFITK